MSNRALTLKNNPIIFKNRYVARPDFKWRAPWEIPIPSLISGVFVV
jgi:hypothetical protein